MSGARSRLNQLLSSYNSEKQRHAIVGSSNASLRRPDLAATGDYRSPAVKDQPDASLYLSGTPHLQTVDDISVGRAPTVGELLPLVQQQASHIQQLEAENSFLKDETRELRHKVERVVNENQQLHDALKKSCYDAIMDQGLDPPARPSLREHIEIKDQVSEMRVRVENMKEQDYGHFKDELVRIQSLHNAKNDRLDQQLRQTKEELARQEAMVEDLRSQLRVMDSEVPVGASRVRGVCLRCAQGEAVLTALPSDTQNQAIQRLSRERDELMDTVAALRTAQEQQRAREEDAAGQVKRSVQLVEAAQLEKMQALVQREQLAEEVRTVRERYEKYVKETQATMEVERNSVRTENDIVVKQLREEVEATTAELAQTRSNLEKEVRDKMSYRNELEAVRQQLSVVEKDYSKSLERLQSDTATALVEREAAVKEQGRVRTDLEKLERQLHGERSKLQAEVADLKRKLDQCDRELMASKEENIKLTTECQNLEREGYLAKVARDQTERGRNEDVEAVLRRGQQREREVTHMMEQMEARHAETVSEMDGILNQQTDLVNKLREECKKASIQIDKLQGKYRDEVQVLRREREELSLRGERLRAQLGDMETQSQHHKCVHQKMRKRLVQMDQHARNQTQQILDLLQQQANIQRDRQLLAREVQTLQRHLVAGDKSALIFDNNQVNDILQAVDDESRKPPELSVNVEPFDADKEV